MTRALMMMKHRALLVGFIAAAQSSQHIFSVHDDIFAYPQHDVVFSDSYISRSEAESRIAAGASDAARSRSAAGAQDDGETSDPGAELSHARAQLDAEDGADPAPDVPSYEMMYLNQRQYLCAIPTVVQEPKNETAEAAARADEEKELERATVRGWELLRDMQGMCMFFTSGWWSYEFCYNAFVKQFHQQPPQKGMPRYPPVEDQSTPSYILGRVRSTEHGRDQRGRGSAGEIGDGRSGVESTELQTKGDVRYLVQKIGAGTVCDLTGKERRIEVQVCRYKGLGVSGCDKIMLTVTGQYHCHPQSPDRIGWVKEVVTCSYLMVIYTPRLCSDAAFLPPRNNQAHLITCQEVLSTEDVDEWKAHKSSEAEEKLRTSQDEAEQDTAKRKMPQDQNVITIGGVEVGGRKQVGSEGRRLDIPGGGDHGDNKADSGSGGSGDKAKVLASSNSKNQKNDPKLAQGQDSNDDRRNEGNQRTAHRLSDEELKWLNLDPETIEALKKEIEEFAGDKGWRIEIVGDDDNSDDDDNDDDQEGRGAGADAGEDRGREGKGKGPARGKGTARKGHARAMLLRGVIEGDLDQGQARKEDDGRRSDERAGGGRRSDEKEPGRRRTERKKDDAGKAVGKTDGEGVLQGNDDDQQQAEDHEEGSEEVYIFVDEL